MRYPARAVGATLFALAFGHVEAAVVAYVRLALVGTLDAAALAEVSDLLTRPFPWGIEVGREAATIVMLAGVALAAGRTLGERAALFLWTFALWDAQYYLSLRLLTGWPPRLDTVDVYFLIPVLWVGPVWLPLVIDAALVAVLARRIWR